MARRLVAGRDSAQSVPIPPKTGPRRKAAKRLAGAAFSLLSATSWHVAANPARVADFTRNEGVPGSSPGVGFNLRAGLRQREAPFGASNRVWAGIGPVCASEPGYSRSAPGGSSTFRPLLRDLAGGRPLRRGRTRAYAGQPIIVRPPRRRATRPPRRSSRAPGP
jgi:hypothetical protein